MASRTKHVGILGAGVMGLASALDLLERGFDVTLFEAAPAPGGLAGSFPFGDTRAEKFYHFVCGSDRVYFRWLERLGLSRRLKWRGTTMAVYRDEKLHAFGDPWSLLRFPPLSPASRLRYGYHVFRAMRLADWRPLESVRAVDWLKDHEGEEPYRVIWEPLLRHKFRDEVENLSAAWIWSRIHRLGSSRDSTFQESLGFVDGGTEAFLDALVAAVTSAGGKLRCGEGVEEIVVESDRVKGVRAAGAGHPLDALLSTAPLPVVERIGRDLPAEYRRSLTDLENIGVRCIVLKLKARVSPHFWINVNDDDVPLCGLIELTNLHPPETFGGYHLLYSPHYVSASDPEYERPDAEVLEETLESVARVVPGFDWRSLVDFRVFRAPYAQPVCPVGFLARQAPIQSPLANFVAGDTSHLLPHDRSISDSLALSERLTAALLRSLSSEGTLAQERSEPESAASRTM
jgi:protoporphyrinogen oxidase